MEKKDIYQERAINELGNNSGLIILDPCVKVQDNSTEIAAIEIIDNEIDLSAANNSDICWEDLSDNDKNTLVTKAKRINLI